MPADEPFLFAHYEVLRKADGTRWELGKGGMGVTYKAFDTKLKVDVVLKLPHEHLMGSERNLRLFLREARAAAKVRHNNIASVIHLNDEPPYYYVMEFVAGMPLDRLLKEKKTLPAREALDILDQIAAALGALSGAQIVHRDLKPANLMLLADEDRPFGQQVKLIDFGLAKGFTVEGEEAATYLQNSLSQAGVFSGTAVFASPEQCAGALDLDTRSDLYSAGVILWQMVTGGVPFTGSLQQIIAKQQLAPPPWASLAEVPSPVVEIIRKLLEKEPGDRFQTPRELREAIREATHRLSPEETSAGLPLGAQPARPLTESLKLGTTLVARYRLGGDLGDGDGGRLFRAADNASEDAPVAVKVVPAARMKDKSFVDALSRQLQEMQRLPDPLWLRPAGGLERSGDGAFFVREWADGFSLDDLLRTRHGEIAASEAWRLLNGLSRSIDSAKKGRLSLAEPILRKLFVTPPGHGTSTSDWQGLRNQPIGSWPPFKLAWNAISFRSPAQATAVESRTQTADAAVSATDDPVLALALLVRQLLGGQPDARTPLTTLRGEANAVLQRALLDGQDAFPSADDFWVALQRAAGVPSPGGAPPLDSNVGGQTTGDRVPRPSASGENAATAASVSAAHPELHSVRVETSPNSPQSRSGLSFVWAILGALAVGAGISAYLFRTPSGPGSSPATGSPGLAGSPIPPPAPSRAPSPVPTAVLLVPTAVPTAIPTAIPTAAPTRRPTPEPTPVPDATPYPTRVPTALPTRTPPIATPRPTPTPNSTSTPVPSVGPELLGRYRGTFGTFGKIELEITSVRGDSVSGRSFVAGNNQQFSGRIQQITAERIVFSASEPRGSDVKDGTFSFAFQRNSRQLSGSWRSYGGTESASFSLSKD